MKAVTVIFPHQLFKQNPAVDPNRIAYLIEESLFFNQYTFHKQKLIFHRATMKNYCVHLETKGVNIRYIEAIDPLSDIRELIVQLHQEQVTEIHFVDLIDNWLEKRITQTCNKYRINCVCYPSPNFLNTRDETNVFFDKRKGYFQTAFYIEQRKQRNILLTSTAQPEGGKWTFDSDNRQKFPKGEKPPIVKVIDNGPLVGEAKRYINVNFKTNYGQAAPFFYPVNHQEAESWLDEFFRTRFEKFGIYEDAIVAHEHYIHHSVISPLLNIGLLNPQQAVDRAIIAAKKYNIPLNSLEGFIRQIIGWREFIRIVYEREGTTQRTKNYWGFTRKIPESFWVGNTGILPVDNVIRKVVKTGYCHHIERLMVMGNFMLLCEFDPDEVYRWFMELFIDAYDWVMVPNVYGMTQFADGGLMTTKPYISGSNYLLKMSDYPKGEWTLIWDALFWRFMHVHRDFFLKNPRLGMLVKTFDKMPGQKRQTHLDRAEQYLETL